MQRRGPTRPRGPTLKARAVSFLARREYARDELARKLATYSDDPAEIETVLDALEHEGWLSTERFAHSLARRLAPRQGTARIVQTLKQYGVEPGHIVALKNALSATEYTRALEVWQKRFDKKPHDRLTYAKQARFLSIRGFAHEVIRRVLGEDE